MAMSKRDYERIAAVLKAERTALASCDPSTYRAAGLQEVDRITKRLASSLKEDSAAFDYPKFLKACGIGEE